MSTRWGLPRRACGQAGEGTAADEHPEDPTVAGYTSKKEDHLRRLRRIEGQVRGLQRMVEGDEYCIDVLTQVSAATKALQAFALGLLDEHMHHCVSDAITGGGDGPEKVAEAMAAVNRLVRS
jgi:DNA-binding FrmR family transcriptional regulator